MTGTAVHPDLLKSAALVEAAATAARYAPSILNTQPWRWRVHPDRLELHAERSRRLPATDPDGWLLLLSCGAALHHAGVALAARGWASSMHRMPDASMPDLLATLVVTDRIPVTADAIHEMRAMRARHTDRRPISDRPLPTPSLHAIAATVTGGPRLHVLTAEQVLDLSVVAERAAMVAARDPRICAELAYWTGPKTPEGTGLPVTVLPDRLAQTTVPGRDFGQLGALHIGPGHDRFAVYAVLYGDDDRPEGWLRAGEALSRAWLAATGLGVSVVPLSDVIQVCGPRQLLRRWVLAGLGYPYLVLRLGIAEAEDSGQARTPRIPVDRVVEVATQ